MLTQVLWLLIASLVTSQLAAIVVILSLPPPALEIYSVDELAQSIREGPSEITHGRQLVASLRPVGPTPQPESFQKRAFRLALAQTINVAPERIVIEQPTVRLLVVRGVSERRGVPSDQPLLFGPFELGVRRLDGRWLVIRPTHHQGVEVWQQSLLTIFALSAMAVTPLAWWFARRLATPIAELAAGAERLGRDARAPPLQPRGSAEVIAAVNAFNEMQERLQRHVEHRTALVGAIAHDLRTPLTRLRFRIEALPDETRAKLAADIDEMEAMVAATMEFVREAARPRTHHKLEIASLVETVLDEAAETGADAAVESAVRLVVDGDPLALKRLLVNLVDNALKFGAVARARVYARDGMAIIEIDDEGPGIAQEDFEHAFEPFNRLEASRSRDTGGLGLGLAVARAIARGHGGDVTLANRNEGGLRATLALPLSL